MQARLDEAKAAMHKRVITRTPKMRADNRRGAPLAYSLYREVGSRELFPPYLRG
jgi:hypothetical protein